MDIKGILNEYSDIVAEIEKMKCYIIELRNKTKNQMQTAETKEEKEIIYNKFKVHIGMIRDNPNVRKKYLFLKNRKKELYNLILSIQQKKFKTKKKKIVTENITYSEEHRQLNDFIKTFHVGNNDVDR